MGDRTINKEELKRQFEEINAQEFRTDVRLSQGEQEQMSPEMQQYHTVESAIQENAKIEELMQNAGVLGLKVREKDGLKFRAQRNSNFQLINLEKTTGDSPFMAAVKASVKEIDKLFDEPVGYSVDREEKVRLAREKVDDAIQKCDAYIGRGVPFWPWHKKRYNAVVATREYLIDNRKMLDDAASLQNIYDPVLKKEDTLLDVMNSDALARRVATRKSDEFSGDSGFYSQAVHGIGSMEYDKTHYDRMLKKRFGKNNVDRTTEMVAFNLIRSEGGVCSNIGKNFEIYEGLTVDLLDKKTREGEKKATKQEKQYKVKLMEQCFKMILDYDMKDFEYASLSKMVRSNKFRENYRMAHLAWDCEDFIKQYRELLQDDRGLDLFYDEKDFKLIEEQRDEMAKMSHYYNLIDAYYENPAVREIDLNKEFALSYDETLAKVEKAAAKNDSTLLGVYNLMCSLKLNGVPSIKLPFK